MEWGCMQALIDFDGWRKWKDLSQQSLDKQSTNVKGKSGGSAASKAKKKNRSSFGSQPSGSTSRVAILEESEVGDKGDGVS